MSNVLDNPAPANPAPEPQPNKYTAGAQEWLNKLRAVAAEFPDKADPRPLTAGEMAVARRTSVTAMQKLAVFAEANRQVADAVVVLDELRDTIAFEMAYTGVIDQASTIIRNIDLAILRRKSRAVRMALDLYRMSKSFASTDAGKLIKPLLLEIRRVLVPRRKKLTATPTDAVEPAAAVTKK